MTMVDLRYVLAFSIKSLALLIAMLSVSSARAETPKRVLMIAGNPSHGFGSHEHYAGLRLLGDTLTAANVGVEVTVTRGWPEDASLVDKADTIVIFSDGGGGHLALPHLDALKAKMATGAGFVCLHYATEVPKGVPGDAWLELQGGYFETDWSVNPHWVAKFENLPTHAVTRGVEPFAANDEWYFHLRFNPKNVTPILQSVAPEATMQRPDGAHSGNPAVRKSVAAGEPQTVAWTFDRADGGRSFGFTGGHFHWNWGTPSIRRLVCNAILWTAHVDVPKDGVSLQPVGIDKLLENQDFPQPKDFNPAQVAKDFSLTSTKTTGSAPSTGAKKPRLLYTSPVVTTSTSGHRVSIDTDLKGARDLFLVVTDGGNDYACDWADWIDPVLYGKDLKKSLLELEWVSAVAGWGEVRKNANSAGAPLSVQNEPIPSPGIGTHANSVVHYRVPEGFTHFRVTGAIDSGGSNQNGGTASSVCFAIYADAAPHITELAPSSPGNSQHEPSNAIAGLEIAEGLEATLSASEPELRSLTNLDIDDRGRVWVCDVMNYRGNQGSRPEGDRILILEDTDGDGVMDKTKVFYQGKDIDSAMGICVLGNEVIVSVAPNVFRFFDDNGDDVADRKVAMFTETGQPQHDHSTHSFLFGPDGKLYWNVGNTGQQVKDANGKIVVDIHGREVIDNGKPFFGGMPFRCNHDGSEFEVLAHNFRNNWETTLDSFGTLWQSDNDDDGNRGTRINFVMEHGNYGYRDEMTGAAWQAERINMEQEIPLRHWHLNDPGVVPNVLQTGAGSPSGICMYEGTLLPMRFQNQVIHCDPGPNVVRAYPMTPQGAGYSATIEPLMTGTQDKWFRPADVCVAPDGSLFVTDWYDPGVGGHRQEDVNRGRLFRLAPPGTKYVVPKFDYSTAEGAADALRNPALSVRYKAWTALHEMGAKAEAALVKLYQSDNPRVRARALWLLGKIEGRGEHYVRQALSDPDADIRIVGIRLLRQLKLVPSDQLATIAKDTSSAVRREALVALKFDKGPAMPKRWAELASQYDGDRWYLEAIGIGSDQRASECFAAINQFAKDAIDKAKLQDILWRLRSPQAAEAIVKIIADPAVTIEATDRYFRSLEFQPADVRTKVLTAAFLTNDFAKASQPKEQAKRDAIVVRTLERIGNVDESKNGAVQASLVRYIESRRGTPEFLTLVKRFQPSGAEQSLLAMALTPGDDSTSVEAVRLLIAGNDGGAVIRKIMQGLKDADSTRMVRLLGLLGNERTTEILLEVASNAEAPYEDRSAAVRGLASNNLGAAKLLGLVSAGKLPGDTKLLAGGLLSRSADAKVRGEAAKLLPMPSQADAKPLPPLDELTKLAGNAANGEALFRSKATCANCHLVNGNGKQVGPDLSEIGTKLSREAMFTSILDPSAGISHNFENYIALLESGQVVNGVKVSETEDEVVIRTAEAIDRTLSRDDITEIKKSEKSIMPDNLHQAIDQQGLVDVVEYMTTLKKK